MPTSTGREILRAVGSDTDSYAHSDSDSDSESDTETAPSSAPTPNAAVMDGSASSHLLRRQRCAQGKRLEDAVFKASNTAYTQLSFNLAAF